MQETEYFKKIYRYSPIEQDDFISIEENGKEAKIRHLNISGAGIRFFRIEESHSDRVGQLFGKESCCTKNTDGIIVFADGDKKNLLLCEMKSSTNAVFDSAYQQSFASYIKVCMLLSLCEGFDIRNYKVYFLFTARSGADLDSLRNELEEIEGQGLRPAEKFELSLLKGEKVRLSLNTNPHDVSFLHSNYINKEVVCQLLTSDSDSIDFDISSLA